MAFLGDVVLSTPLISAIREKHPEAKLWMMTTALGAKLVENDPLLTGVIVFDKRGKHKGISGIFKMAKILESYKFDSVYSLHRALRTTLALYFSKIPKRIGYKEARLSFLYNERKTRVKVLEGKKLHDVERNMSLLEFKESKSQEFDMRIFPPPKEKLSKQVQDFLNSKKEYIAIAPGSAWKTKMWSGLGYREVAKNYLEKGYEVVLLGSPDERKKSIEVGKGLELRDFIGKTTIGETIALVKNAKLLFCNDSMILHLCSALKTPNVAIFCATNPEFGFGPWRNNALVVQKEGLKCNPCRRHGSQVCPTRTEACMNLLSYKKVVEAGDELIKRVSNESSS